MLRPGIEGCEGLWSYDYGHAQTGYTRPYHIYPRSEHKVLTVTISCCASLLSAFCFLFSRFVFAFWHVLIGVLVVGRFGVFVPVPPFVFSASGPFSPLPPLPPQPPPNPTQPSTSVPLILFACRPALAMYTLLLYVFVNRLCRLFAYSGGHLERGEVAQGRTGGLDDHAPQGRDVRLVNWHATTQCCCVTSRHVT